MEGVTLYNFGIGEFTWDAADELMHFVNAHAHEDCHFKIHLKSNGGIVSAMMTMAKVLNDHSHEIHVISAESSGFEFLYLTDGLVFIEDNSYGMYHYGHMYIKYMDGNKHAEITKLQKKISDLELKRVNEIMVNLKFTDRERKKLEDGNDVYFDAVRLRELFEYKDGYKIGDNDIFKL